MAEQLIVLRTDQTAARQSQSLQSLAAAGRAFYFELQRHKLLMRSGFDDGVNPIDWSQLETVWGAPVEEIGNDPQGKVLWDIVNGTLLGLDSNNDFQKLIKRVC